MIHNLHITCINEKQLDVRKISPHYQKEIGLQVNNLERSKLHPGSISPTFNANLLLMQIPKAQRKTDSLTVLYVLLGLVWKKNCSKMMLKSTQVEVWVIETSYSGKRSSSNDVIQFLITSDPLLHIKQFRHVWDILSYCFWFR